MSRRRRIRKKGPNLNLVPLLDMVSVLIQMLLLTAQFGSLSEVETFAPALNTDPKPPPADHLEVGLHLRNNGMLLFWAGPKGSDQRQLNCPDNTCKDLSSYPLQALETELSSLKSESPDTKQILVIPDVGVPFEVLIGVTDKVRGNPLKRTLFPEVILGSESL